MGFVPAFKADDLWEGEMVQVEVAGELILLLNVGGEIRAYQGLCPHQRSPLADGTFEEETLICSAHLWEFDARTGEGVNPTGCRLERYPVKIEDGAIYVEVSSREGSQP